ncbi:MAG TPA: alkaline phosphatase D family protein, partial [Thermoanaerobaculia bacterium]|nr:alkaline phosphatase D family protein [Thermoanaerobaculia bacterium]
SGKQDLIAKTRLSALEFGTEYEYEVYLDGRLVELAYPTRFATQPMWSWRTDPPAFTIAAGSCAYINETSFDRPGTPYGGGYEIFTTIAAAKPDAMIWLGDNVYYREADWEDESGMRYRYAHGRALPELQPLLASTSQYATWDDHDYGPNDADRSYPMRDETLEIFRDYWFNRTHGTLETPGVFHSFRWGDIDFFLLDDRFYRSPNTLPEEQREMFGQEQMRWLFDSLASSRAPFKIVVNGNQMLNPQSSDEVFSNFPAEQRRLIDFITEAKIEGVLFLTGDRHHTVLMRREFPGLYPLYDVTTSPLTAGLYDPKDEQTNPAVVEGTLNGKKRNFALLEFSGPRRERVLTVRVIAADGSEIWRRVVPASELRFPD